VPDDSAFLVLNEKESVFDLSNGRRNFLRTVGMQYCFTYFVYHRVSRVKLQLVNGNANRIGITFFRVLEASIVPDYKYCFNLASDLPRGQYRIHISSVTEPQKWSVGDLWELAGDGGESLFPISTALYPSTPPIFAFYLP
jgi:hypothetical protein